MTKSGAIKRGQLQILDRQTQAFFFNYCRGVSNAGKRAAMRMCSTNETAGGVLLQPMEQRKCATDKCLRVLPRMCMALEKPMCSKNCGRGFRRRKVRCLAARRNSVLADKANDHTFALTEYGNRVSYGTLCTILARHRGQAQARIFSVDFMVAHSSFPRYISWRCTAHGSWFIQAICKGFSEMAAQTDLLTMMTEVNALVQRLELHNWGGNFYFCTQNIQYPRTTAEVQHIVKSAKKLRVIGSRHSFTKIGDSCGTILSTLGMNSIIKIDKASFTVTVQPGITYTDLSPILCQ
uniref:FAD-binding PCMH-type domain-containing protein n=1 Tax=Globodera rostochiensis TaxID=31243 RepID=A0A914HL08_GLORO